MSFIEKEFKKKLKYLTLINYFLLFILSFYLFSCTDVSKGHIGEIDNVCYEDDTCDEGLKCVSGKNNNICVKLCNDVTCSGKGNCIVEDNIEVCKCDQGYEATELNCFDVDECVKGSDNCSSDATCTNTQGSFSCQCNSGFEGNGVTCVNIYECFPNPCQNNGICKDEVNGFTCTCKPGFEGDNCETNTNDCNPNPCQNGGSCTDGIDRYICDCADGYTGKDCDEKLDKCDPNPCQNDGVCRSEETGYSCECADGYEGDDCGVNTNDCNPNPCIYGDCTDGINSYSCTCYDGYMGDNCDSCLSGYYMDEDGNCNEICDSADTFTKDSNNFKIENAAPIVFEDGNWDNDLNTESFANCTTTEDWYKLIIESGDKLTIEVTASSLSLYLYKEGSEENLGNGTLTIQDKILYEEGTYFIKVNTNDRSTHNYNMRITKESLCSTNTYNSREYKFCKILSTWTDAVQNCTNMGLHLLTINDSEENNFIFENSSTFSANSWIGLNDRAVEGEYKWIRTGNSTPEFRNWNEGEPNDASNEDCVEIHKSNGTWNDVACSQERDFICN